LRVCRPNGRTEEHECAENPKNQHACDKIIRLEYARPFIWRSAHGQETPQDGKEDGKVSQVHEQENVEEKDREGICEEICEEIRQAISQTICEAQYKTRRPAAKRSTSRTGCRVGSIVDGNQSGNDASVGRRSATFIGNCSFRGFLFQFQVRGGARIMERIRTRNLEREPGTPIRLCVSIGGWVYRHQ
jgi:hypothetical protein